MAKRRARPRVDKVPTSAARSSVTAGMLKHVRAILVGVLPVIAVATFTRVALADTYHIPSGSMEPTLQVGDWLTVNKLRYGPHVPFTDVNLPGYAEPSRGDVVVFESPPQDPSIRISPDEVTPTLVKRLVGMPGDTLAMRGGELFVNSAPQARYSSTTADADGFVREPLPIFRWQHRYAISSATVGTAPAQPSMHDWGPLVVPFGAYFMMGDNRDNSVDSRFYGFVPRRNVRGRPMFVYYSYDVNEGEAYVRAVTAIRWSRIGRWIR
jgi:signal peptidase I